MVIAHNINALNAQRQYNVTTQNQKKSTEKLSSGYRINRAADDAAGLSISEKMRRLIRGLDRGADNISEGISLVQTADGALEEVIENLQRIRELSIAAYNETNSESDIAAMQAEVDQALTEIERIGETTTFNGKQILQGTKTVYAGKTPDTIETYDEVTIQYRRVPDWLWDNSDKKMGYGNDRGNSAAGVDVGIMYTEEEDPVTKESKLVYYGPEIPNPDQGAEHRRNWNDDLSTHACAALDFSGLTTIDNGETLYNEMINLLGVGLKYPCGNCGDQRTGVHFVGTVDDLPFETVYGQLQSASTDQISDIDLASSNFAYTTPDGNTYQAQNGYFQAISELLDRQSANATMTDDQKKAETLELAKAIAKDLASRVFDVLEENSKGHYDRVVRDKNKPDYSMIVFDYRDADALSDKQKAKAPVISPAEGYVIVREEKTRIIEGEDYYAQEGITIVPGTEYAKSIELTLPKITLDELSIKGYRVGTQYDKKITYSYGQRAQAKLIEAREQYEKDMEEYEKKMKQYKLDYYAWEKTGTLKEVVTQTPILKTETHTIDGHLKTVTKIEGYEDNYSYYMEYPTDPPQKPEKPSEPQLTDFSAYADMIVTKTLREDTLDPIDNALAKVLAARSILGAEQNRLEHAYNINKNTEENEQAAESRIRDTDMSEEMVNYSKNSILVQAGQAMIAQANQQPQEVLQLLQ